MWQSLVNNASHIRARQTAEDIAEFSISDHKLQSLFYGMYQILFLKFSETLKKVIGGLFLFNTALYFQNYYVLKQRGECNKEVKKLFRAAEDPICVIETGESLRHSYEKKAFHKI